MKNLYFLLVLSFLWLAGNGQSPDTYNSNATEAMPSANYFRSVTSGNWENESSWESSTDGTTWLPATHIPASAANTITIRNGDSITIAASGLSLDQVIIEAGAQLAIDSNITFILSDGAGTDLDVKGTFLNAGGSHTWSGTMVLDSGSTYIHNTTASADDAYNAATIHPYSTWIYRGSSSLPVNITLAGKIYGHLRLQSSAGELILNLPANDSCIVNNLIVDTSVNLIPEASSYVREFIIYGDYINRRSVYYNNEGYDVIFRGVDKLYNNDRASFSIRTAIFATGSSYTVEYLAGFAVDTLIIEEDALLDGGDNINNIQYHTTINGTFRTAYNQGLRYALNTSGDIIFGSNSTISFNRSSQQNFTARDDYANVEIRGRGQKRPYGNVTVNGTLFLTDSARLTLYDDYNLVVNKGITGGSATTYISTYGTGAVTINDIGNNPVVFPIGVFDYTPVTISNAGTADNFSVRVEADTLPCAPADKSVIYTWHISEATTGGSDCTISLGYESPFIRTGSNFNPLLARIVHCKADSTSDYSNGIVTGRTATGTGFTHFSPFGITSDAVTLPVIFANVKAVEQGAGILVSWSNLTETEVQDYTVEHSSNGSNFVGIGFINPRSNSGDREDYSFLHNNGLADVNYYRIRSTELDGNMKYSIVAKVDRRKGQTLISIYPNPSSGSDIVMQATDLAKGRYTMTVYATNGQQVAVQTFKHNGGSVTEPVWIPAALKAGVYTLLLQSTETSLTSRFVVR